MHIVIILDNKKLTTEATELLTQVEERSYSVNKQQTIDTRKAALISAIEDSTALIQQHFDSLADIA